MGQVYVFAIALPSFLHNCNVFSCLVSLSVASYLVSPKRRRTTRITSDKLENRGRKSLINTFLRYQYP